MKEFVICLKFREVFRNFKVIAKKTNRSSFQMTFMGFIGKGPNFEFDVISKKTLLTMYDFDIRKFIMEKTLF